MVKIMENSIKIKMDDLGVPPFKETPIYTWIFQICKISAKLGMFFG